MAEAGHVDETVEVLFEVGGAVGPAVVAVDRIARVESLPTLPFVRHAVVIRVARCRCGLQDGPAADVPLTVDPSIAAVTHPGNHPRVGGVAKAAGAGMVQHHRIGVRHGVGHGTVCFGDRFPRPARKPPW